MRASLSVLNRCGLVVLMLIICASTPATSQNTTSVAAGTTSSVAPVTTTTVATTQGITTAAIATTNSVTTTSAPPPTTTSTTQPVTTMTTTTTTTTAPTTSTTTAFAFLPPIKVAAAPPTSQAFTSEEQTAVNVAISQLKNVIANFLKNQKADAPSNSAWATQINAKIAMLENPELYNNIVNSKFFVVDFATSTGGKRIPIVATFPLPELRDEAWYAVELTKLSLSVLEDFYASPYIQARIDVWYGFAIGSSGGGGVLNMEDKTTYQARWRTGMQFYDSVICHELGHSYMAHESLNQFTEIYVYNMIATNSNDFKNWIYFRDYKTWQGTKTGYAALLDVYQLLGLPTMEKIYRKIKPLNPPYGKPIPAECRQVFVDEAPAELKAQVSGLMAGVTY
jgi:hypothetical protein